MEPRAPGTEVVVTALVAIPRITRNAAAPRISARAAGEAREPPKAMHVPRREIPSTPFCGDERKRAVFRTRAFAGPAGPGARGAEVGLRWTAGTKTEPAVAERRLASFGTGPRDALWPRKTLSKRPFPSHAGGVESGALSLLVFDFSFPRITSK